MIKLDGVKIPSLDAKDIYIANYLYPNKGYNLKRKDGSYNLSRFKNALDYSLDLIKLREVYNKIYRNKYFSWFEKNEMEYTTRVINVTFKYSNKKYNKIGSIKENELEKKKGKIKYPKYLYVKFGYEIEPNCVSNCVYIENGELIAIQTGIPVDEDKVVPKRLLGENFYYEDGVYKIKSNETLNTVADLRNKLYRDGFWCNGIHYVRFKRSSGSSRVGKCLFIDEKLYKQMHKWEMCGIKIKEGDQVDLAALEAYIALTLSSIVDTIEIDTKGILIVDDYESIFKDRVIATEIINVDGKYTLQTSEKDVEISNSIWDGQSLIDKSIMGDYAEYGMILLRKNFFKSCCFNTNIQQFFKDNNITEINQLNGYTQAEKIEDIILITTPSSIKYLKFGTIKQWLKNIDSTFGVVKHEKKTHFFDGTMVQSHYQLINTLQMSKEEVKEFIQPSLDYIDLLKKEPAAVRDYMKYSDEQEFESNNLKTKNEIIYKLMGLNADFTKTKWYEKDLLLELIRSYKRNLKSGHVLIEGNYSTLLGNPYEMLLQSIGLFHGKSELGVGNVHSTRFPYGTKILGSRSPHVCVSNILLANNTENKLIDKYFNLTDEIICINSIRENILEKLNGADFDSDTIMITNNKLLIEAAKRNYSLFKVPTNMVTAKKTVRYYTPEQKADLDIKTSVNKIGDIINLSQELQTYMWHQLNHGATYEDIEKLYFDICQLAVLSNLEIDKAKKEFDIDSKLELQKLKDKWIRHDDTGRVIKPFFFGFLAKEKGYYNPSKKNYMHHDTSMDYLHKLINKHYLSREKKLEGLEIYDIIDDSTYNYLNVRRDNVNKIINMITDFSNYSYTLWNSLGDKGDKYKEYNETKKWMYKEINQLTINKDTLICLFRKFRKENTFKRYIITILFNIGNHEAFDLIKQSTTEIPFLIKDEYGHINIYGKKYSKIYKKASK